MPQSGIVAVGGPADWTAADYRDIDTGSATLCDDEREGFQSAARLMLWLSYNVRGGRSEGFQAPEERRGYFAQAPLVVQADSRAGHAGPGG